jgi:hypothetical protein
MKKGIVCQTFSLKMLHCGEIFKNHDFSRTPHKVKNVGNRRRPTIVAELGVLRLDLLLLSSTTGE